MLARRLVFVYEPYKRINIVITAGTSCVFRVTCVLCVYIVCLCEVYIMYYDRIMSVIYVLGGGVVGNLTISPVIYNCILVHVLTRYYIF